jgi:hypothetical protein
MAITATNTGGTNYTPIEAGNYVARCYQMVQIGTVVENILGENKTMNKVRLSWELPTELKVFKEENGEQPYSLSKEFTLSLHEKATLRKFLAGWRGKDFTDEESKAFDITVLVGKECMLNIIHKESKQGKIFAEISSISTLPKGMKCPIAINKPFILSYDAFDEEKFNILPDFIKDKMKTSAEFKALKNPQSQDLTPNNAEDIDTFSNNKETGLPF